MAENLVVNDVTYPDVEAVSMTNEAGEQVAFYPDAVRYNPQTLTDAQKAQARTNMGAASAEELSSLSAEIGNVGDNIAYGTCSTAADVAAKAVTLSNNSEWALKVGRVVMVCFTTSNSASNVTLNVNGTGDYPIWYNNAEYTGTSSAYTGYAKRVTTYMFNGTHWVWVCSSYDTNSTYSNASLGQGYATCSTAAATTAKTASLSSYTLTKGGIVAVKFSNAVPAGATLNINSKGAKKMFFRGAAITADVVKAGDVATFVYDGTQYQMLSIDRWQKDIVETVALPMNNGTPVFGTAGQFAVSDGAGGITWLSLTNVAEVGA